MYIQKNNWGFGQYRLVKPQRIMWETPVSPPMSVTGNDTGPWAGFGEGPDVGPGTVAAFGVGTLLLGVLSLVATGAVVIWVVNSIRKG